MGVTYTCYGSKRKKIILIMMFNIIKSLLCQKFDKIHSVGKEMYMVGVLAA